jgi:hypothetical protein
MEEMHWIVFLWEAVQKQQFGMLLVPWKLCAFQPVAETFQSHEVRAVGFVSDKAI